MPNFIPSVNRHVVDEDTKRIVVKIPDNTIEGTVDPHKKPTAAIYNYPSQLNSENELEHNHDDGYWYGDFCDNANTPNGFAIVTVFFDDGAVKPKTVINITDA